MVFVQDTDENVRVKPHLEEKVCCELKDLFLLVIVKRILRISDLRDFAILFGFVKSDLFFLIFPHQPLVLLDLLKFCLDFRLAKSLSGQIKRYLSP